ncbi:MAG: hypothetical protein Q9M13_05230, partial [Mariprofundales bacterium]|nr:hypothetical protein [Mariprofundales bacterium]
ISHSIATIRQAATANQPASPTSTGGQHQQRQLEEWLKNAQHTKDNPITGTRLAALIRNSGQLLEHKLLESSLLQIAQQSRGASPPLESDLKMILATLAERGAAASPPPSTSQPAATHLQQPLPATASDPSLPPQQSAHHLAHRVAEAAQQGVQRIESGQIHALLSSIHHEPMRVEFPMVVFNQLVTVQMAIMEHEQHHKSAELPNERSLNILMALNMSHLGEVRIDSTISSTTLLARIYLASDEAAQFTTTHLPRLTSKIEAAGFSHVQIVTTNQPPDTGKREAFSQLTSMVPKNASLLDIEI